MKKKIINLLGAFGVALFLVSQLAIVAQGQGRGGRDGGGHGGGGGGHSGGGGGGGGNHAGNPGGISGAGRANVGHAPSAHGPHSGGNSFQGSIGIGGIGIAIGPGGHHSGNHFAYPTGPMAYNHGAYNHWYHGDWHNHYQWDQPWHYRPMGWWSAGFATGAVVWDTPWQWGYWSYYNPYSTTVLVIDNSRIDYSQPLAIATPAATNQIAADDEDSENDPAEQYLDAAREAFAQADYTTAMTQVNQAIVQKPNDSVPHEFRALVLFANKQYKDAAGTIYAVLSIGPGWDWATMSGFYPDPNVYTTQLRDLEQYRNDHPKLPEIRFLLAYHYMTCGHSEAAVGELKEVVKLSPKDQLSAQLLTSLSQNKSGDTAPPAPAAPSAPAKPVAAASLVGNWTSTRADGASFSLDIAKDGTYAWKYTQQGKSKNFSGAYTVADNLLILKEDDNPTMIGQVVLTDATHFNFKLAGNNRSDPGITFSKK